MKQTIKVAQLLDESNDHLKHSTVTLEFRKGVIFTLEAILFATGNYRGYRYLNEKEVPVGELPGIWSTGTDYDSRFNNTDSTRIAYYC